MVINRKLSTTYTLELTQEELQILAEITGTNRKVAEVVDCVGYLYIKPNKHVIDCFCSKLHTSFLSYVERYRPNAN